MSLHPGHVDVFPVHILGGSLVYFEIESAKQMSERKIELSVRETGNISC